MSERDRKVENLRNYSSKLNVKLSHQKVGTIVLKCDPVLGRGSVTQLARLFLNILPFPTMRICRIAYKIGQSKLKTLPNTI